MKKVTSLLLLAGVAAFGLVGCGDDVVTQPDDPQVQSVTVSPSSISIEVGEQATLAANVQADDGADTSVSWSSSNSSVASVDGSGNVTGQSTGSATIVATSNADASKSGAAEVTVTQAGGERPTVNIQGINCFLDACSEPDSIVGDFQVEVKWDEGDQDIAAVQLLLNGEVVREQTLSTNVTGLSTATEGVTNVVWTVDSDGAGECTTGQQLTPNFQNGMYELQARLLLEAGDDETATWDDSLNFQNGNRVEIVHIDGTGATAIGGGDSRNSEAPEGQRFWGHDFMNMATVNDTLHFAACPVVFDADLTVEEIRLSGDTDDSFADGKNADVDLGSGHGALQADDAEPWQYLADPALNDGSEGDDMWVEDTNAGHDFGESGGDIEIFDAEGEDVTGEFEVVGLLDFWLDFTAPMEEEEGGSAIQIDEMAITSEHYTDEVADYVLPDGTVFADGDPDGDGIPSDYNIVGIVDNGVGVDLDAQPTDVYHDTAAAIGGASVPVAEDVEGLNDGCPDGCVLPEQGPDTDPDWYVANVPELIDLLKNSMTTEDIPTLNASTAHGVDRTEPTITPADTIPDGKIIDDTEIVFEAADPDLDNDADPVDPGSGVNDDGCDAGGPCDAIFAALGDTVDLGTNDNGTAGDADFAIDLTDAIGIGLPEGQTDITLSVPDRGIKAPNPATLSYSFIFDTTPPTVGFAGVTGLNESDADFVEFTVDGDVTDRNGDGTAVTSAILTVALAGTDDVCNTGDDVTDPAIHMVSPAVDTVTAQVNSNDGMYSSEFQAENLGGENNEVRYCFLMTADDGAMTADGADAAHETTSSAGKNFTWNPAVIALVAP